MENLMGSSDILAYLFIRSFIFDLGIFSPP